jgi:probable metal-binding protein
MMTTAQAIHGYEIIGLIDSFPQGIRLGQLFEVVAERFGEAATFHTSSAGGLDFDALLFSLEAREKVRISRGVVYPGGPPP